MQSITGITGHLQQEIKRDSAVANEKTLITAIRPCASRCDLLPVALLSPNFSRVAACSLHFPPLFPDSVATRDTIAALVSGFGLSGDTESE